MAIVRSGSADLGGAIGDGSLRLFSPKPYEPTSLELLASSISRTPNPNPNPRKRKWEDSSISPSTTPSSEAVLVHEAPAPVVEDELKEKPVAEQEGKDDDNDDDDNDDAFDFSGPEPNCGICGGDHITCFCAYLTRIPDGGKVLNDRDYMIICDCGEHLDDKGRCSSGNCVPWRPKCVVRKADLERGP